MRLLDRVMAEGVHGLPSDWTPPPIRVIADEPWRMYWQGKNEWDFRDDFGPLTPPFPDMWVEGRMPRSVFVEGEWGTLTPAHRMTHGCCLRTHRASDGKWWVMAQYFAALEHHHPVLMPWGSIVDLGQNGDYVARKVVVPDEAKDALRANVDFDELAPCMLAVSLMNCKNVRLVDERVPPRVAAKRLKATGQPALKFTRIVLPSAVSHASTHAQVKKAVGEAQPLHFVRGHFKTYTDEAPLFGNKTGTWWWDAQARGNSAKGVRIPTYEVRPP